MTSSATRHSATECSPALVSTQAAVLERNFPPEIAAAFKHGALANLGTLIRILRTHLPELGEADAVQFADAAVTQTRAVRTHAQPSATMLAAYEVDPELVAMRLDFVETLGGALEVFLRGLPARAAD